MRDREGASSFHGGKSMGAGVVSLEGLMGVILHWGASAEVEDFVLSPEVVKGLRSSPLALAVLKRSEDGNGKV